MTNLPSTTKMNADTQNRDAATQQIEDLLRDTLCTYTRNHSAISIDSKRMPGATYFKLQVHGDDQPSVVGRQGAHIKALGSLFAAIGRANGQFYKIALQEPEIERLRQPYERVEIVDLYDTGRAERLLKRVVEAVGIGDFVIERESARQADTISPRPLKTFRMIIWVRSNEDFALLTRGDDTRVGSDAEALICHIGTLFRAFAMKDGVRFQVDVKQD